ncbi:MAG: winged helix DNA-binding domain-containing protein [Propionibacteriaceae bacterium]|nr:winged helix DNA-binding domain-containing protein [Propionibacteriaceae bacterium]
MKTREIAARRLIAQLLAPSQAHPLAGRELTPHDVCRWMLAIQGQNYTGGLEAVAIRQGRRRSRRWTEGAEADLEAGRIARCWPQRGTLHFMAAEDVAWLSRLCGLPRANAYAAWLGLPAGFDEPRRVLHEALAAGPLTRRQCYEAFARAGLDQAARHGPRLLRVLGSEGMVVQGARRGAEEVFRLTDQLPVPQRTLTGEEALAELATRYVSSHGPATLDDLVWWTHCGRTTARRALELGTGYHRDGAYYVPDWQAGITTRELERALARTYTLPPFDEYLLGYTDRTGILPEELRPQVLTSNGLSWHFTVRRGVVRGRAERLTHQSTRGAKAGRPAPPDAS